VLAFAAALGADRGFVAACLPAVELAILKRDVECEDEDAG
jgi:hypothetical protein